MIWDIEADGDGARLTFAHDNFADTGPGYEGTVAGWPRFVESLQQVLTGNAGVPM